MEAPVGSCRALELKVTIETVNNVCNARNLFKGSQYLFYVFGVMKTYRNATAKCCVCPADTFQVLAIPIGSPVTVDLFACVGLTEELFFAFIPKGSNVGNEYIST